MNWVIPTKALEARNSACSASYSTTKERFLARASRVALRSSETSQWAQISVAIIPYILKHANWSSTTIFNNQAFFSQSPLKIVGQALFKTPWQMIGGAQRVWKPDIHKKASISWGLTNFFCDWWTHNDWKSPLKISQTSFAIFRLTKNALNSFLVNKVICHSFSRSEQNETKIFRFSQTILATLTINL